MGPFGLYSVLYGPFGPDTVPYEPFGALEGPLWALLGLIGSLWAFWARQGPVWTLLGPCGPPGPSVSFFWVASSLIHYKQNPSYEFEREYAVAHLMCKR